MNKFIFTGGLVRKPELQQGKVPFMSNAIAVERYDYSKKEKVTDFFNFMVFGKDAEYLAKYAQPGSKILIEGTVQNDEWKNPKTKRIEKYDKYVVQKAELFSFKEKQNNNESDPFESYDVDENIDEDLPF